MAAPHLFTNPESIEKIKEHLKKYPWYLKSFKHIQTICDEMLQRGFEVPDQKGYAFNETCRAHNTALIFDPYDRDSFMCPVCKINYQDEPYKRAWITLYHCWLSQMSMYLGICYIITNDNVYAKAVKKIMDGYIQNYPKYPNKDNEIGTAKVFQATFLDSIWLTYICGGYDIVNSSEVFNDTDRNKCLELFKSAALVIREYDEKWNNRQAFNNAGMCAAALLTEDLELLDHVLNGEHGFIPLMEHSILEDGLWYEGDNYHFATVPSIVNIAEMCLNNGIDLYNRSFKGRSIKDMFYGPLKSLQPDGTFPSRKDSPYASSVAQRWYACLYELAYARFNDKPLADFLNLLYSQIPDKSTPLSSAAGIMDMWKPDYASREQLDWRAFLTLNPETYQDKALPVTDSINMKGTGLAVLRREDSYMNLDYGNYGGGHGHPDRLNITCFLNSRRWFADFGTGNYYLDHLTYYRSTLGHNTVNQDGKRQSVVSGKCDLFYKGDLFDAASGVIDEIYPNTFARRTVVLFDGGYAFDYIAIESEDSHVYHNVYHGPGSLNDESYSFSDSLLKEEGYEFLSDIKKTQVSDGYTNIFKDEKADLYMYSSANLPMVQYSAKAYGSPKLIPKLFPVLIQEKSGAKAIFANIYEDVEHGINRKIKSFKSIDDYVFEVAFMDGSFMSLDVSSGVEVAYSNNQDVKKEKAIYEKTIEKDQDISYECWVDYNNKDNTPFAIGLRNHNSYQKQTEIFGKDITVEPYSQKILKFPLDNQGITIENGYLKANLSKNKTPYIKKIVDVIRYDGKEAVNEVMLEKNIHINEQKNISRAERKWKGVEDLSASGSLLTNGGRSLTLVLHVKDDNVLFDAGKYDYDNDSIQLYFDRRHENYRDVEMLTDGIYALFLKAGANGNVSRVIPITKGVKNIIDIAVSIGATQDGYDVCIDIPFHCIGGKPLPNEVWGFDIIINDRDSGVRRDLMAYWSGTLDSEWTYMCETLHDPRKFGLLRF